MAGFFFNNPDGTRQFDSNNWPCIGIVSKVSVPSASLVGGAEFPFWTARFIDITVTGVSPMIALHIPASLHPVGGYPEKVGGIYSTRKIGSSFTFRIYIFSTNSDWSFTYYVIDRMTVPHDGMGLTFWSEDGAVVFSTAMKHLQVAGSQTVGRKYAAVGFVFVTMTEDFNDDFSNPSVRYEVTAEGFYALGDHVYAGSKVADGGVVSGTSGPPFSGRDIGVRCPPLYIDVTGI